MNQLFSRLTGVQGMNAKSNALSPLLWLIGLTLIANLASALIISAPKLLSYVLVAGLIIELIAVFVAYFYFMQKNPDCLRSETYALSKIAIEQGRIGDNNSGLITDRPQVTETVIIEEQTNE